MVAIDLLRSPIKLLPGLRVLFDIPVLMDINGFWDFETTSLKRGLWEEELYLPAVAIGIRDVIGTGYLVQYLVASKALIALMLH